MKNNGLKNVGRAFAGLCGAIWFNMVNGAAYIIGCVAMEKIFKRMDARKEKKAKENDSYFDDENETK